MRSTRPRPSGWSGSHATSRRRSVEEIERVAVYAETHGRDGAVRSSAWAAPLIGLGAETAMRRNEILDLRWEQVDLDARHLTVACTEVFTTKSGRERRIPLSARAADLLVNHPSGNLEPSREDVAVTSSSSRPAG